MSDDSGVFIEAFASKVQDIIARTADQGAGASITDVTDIKAMIAEIGKDEFMQRLLAATQTQSDRTQPVIVAASGQPLKCWEPDFWTKQFPHLFCYGDGVYGLRRRTSLTFHQWVVVILRRTELFYNCIPEHAIPVCPLTTGSSCENAAACAICAKPYNAIKLPQPRWSADINLRFVLYDCWRRIEILRKAGMHVRKKGFQQNIALIAGTDSDKILQAFKTLGHAATLRDAMLDDRVDPSLRRALKDIIIFSTDVVGSEGSRVNLRYQQVGTMIRYGVLQAFITPNVNDISNPLMVLLHEQSNGMQPEHLTLSLLDESPEVKSKKHMLEILSQNQAAQATFFIFSYQLFLMHVLGTGPVDDFLNLGGDENVLQGRGLIHHSHERAPLDQM